MLYIPKIIQRAVNYSMVVVVGCTIIKGFNSVPNIDTNTRLNLQNVYVSTQRSVPLHTDNLIQEVSQVNLITEETITETTTEVTTGSIIEVGMDLPTHIDNSFKTFMDFSTITDKTSKQYQLQQANEVVTDNNGLRRYGDCYIVAVGTYYGEVGTILRVKLDTDTIIHCLVGDIKQDIHTDTLNQHRNGNILEFIVDTDKLNDLSRKMGDVSYADPNLKGNIVEITKLKGVV